MIKKFIKVIFVMIISLFGLSISASAMTLIKEGKLGTTFSDTVFRKNICASSIECQLANGQNADSANKIYVFADVTKYETAKYFVTDLYFVPLEGLESITLQTKSAVNVSEKQKDGWIENRLNRLRAIYEMPDKNCEYGYATFYINGVLKMDRVPCKKAMNFSNIRVSFNGVNKDTLLKMYVSRYKYYAANENPYGIKYPIIKSGGKTFLNSVYLNEGETSAGDIVFENAETKIYSDDSFLNLKLNTDMVVEGDIAVVESEGEVFYFDVKYLENGLLFDSEMNLNDENIVENVKNGDSEIVIKDGKAVSLQLINKNNYSNVEYDYQIPFAEFFDGIELKMQVYSDDISGLQFMSELGAEISNRAYALDSTFQTGKWNDVRLVFDKRKHAVKFYVDNNLISEKYFEKLGIDESYSLIRLQMFGKAGTSGYIRNQRVYYSLDEGKEESGYKISLSTAASFSDLTVYAPENITVSDLSELFDGKYTVTDGFGNTRKSDESINEGDYALTEKDGFKRFTIKKLDKDKLIQLDETPDETVVISFGGNEDFKFYSVNYSENGISNVNVREIEKGKINCFNVKKGGDKTKAMLWSTNLIPGGKALE